MAYKHAVYIESPACERLAVLAAEAASELAVLAYVPRVHYFKEDPAGRYARDVRCSGFIDYRTSSTRCDVFCRGGMGFQETAATIFHEVQHVAQFSRDRCEGR
jgi:hypothetical protein